MSHGHAHTRTNCIGCEVGIAVNEDEFPVCRSCWVSMSVSERASIIVGIQNRNYLREISIHMANGDGEMCEVARLAKAVENQNKLLNSTLKELARIVDRPARVQMGSDN